MGIGAGQLKIGAKYETLGCLATSRHVLCDAANASPIVDRQGYSLVWYAL